MCVHVACILDALSLFDPQQLPPGQHDCSEFEMLGNTSIKTLSTHYITSISNSQDLEVEWIGFKQFMAETFMASSTTEVMQVIVKANSL